MELKIGMRSFGLAIVLAASSAMIWAQSASAGGAAQADAAASAAQRSVNAAGAADAAASTKAGPGAAAVEATNVSAELTQKLSSKNAKVGDAVTAKTMSAARISNGTTLPKGTKLLGHVTEAQAKSGAQHDGHLAFVFDRAVLRDGQEVPIHAGLRSISAPAIAAATDADGAFSGGLAGPVSAGGSGGGGGRIGGGLAGGVVGAGGSALSGATSTLGSTTGNVAGNVGGAVDQTAGVRVGSGATAGLGTSVAGGAELMSVPVHNLPGVTANGSASGSANASGVLDAHGHNVDLNGGTQMVFAVSAN